MTDQKNEESQKPEEAKETSPRRRQLKMPSFDDPKQWEEALQRTVQKETEEGRKWRDSEEGKSLRNERSNGRDGR